jgi:hypothetical protein
LVLKEQTLSIHKTEVRSLFILPRPCAWRLLYFKGGAALRCLYS